MGVIFDLDQTLINSSAAEPLRKKRDWQSVYKMIPGLKPFIGVNELISDLNRAGVPVCIVTSAPATYCRRVVDYWGWKVQGIVGYHDTDQRKPYPAPILKGLEHLTRSAAESVSIGDDPKDIFASRSAKVFSVGALWGSMDHDGLRLAKPDALCAAVRDLDGLIRKRFRLAFRR